MEQQQEAPKKPMGTGKEDQLSKIAAAVNLGSHTEANPESTKTMIDSFIKNFDTVGLELIREMDDDQENLVKTMVDEITKLQTKNMQEFEKAIGKIIGISNRLIESSNPKLQQLGSQMQEQAKTELLQKSGFNLYGENDTVKNRLKRQISGNASMDNENPEEKTTGLGKIKGFLQIQSEK